MLFLPEKINFRVYLKNSVSGEFVEEVKLKMLESSPVDFKNKKVDQMLWGADMSAEIEDSVGSFLNIPLVISGKTVGYFSLADARPNFFKEKEILAVTEIAKRATDAFTKLQDAVESENNKMNSLVSSMTDGVLMTDMDYRLLVVNSAARRAAGLENKADLSVLDFAESLKEKFDLKDKIEESIRLDKVFTSEEFSRNVGFFKVLVSSVRDKYKPLGCVVVFRDITKEKEIEQIKEDFISMIVHELRSPLDSIKKMIELMRAAEMKKAKRQECYQMIHSSSSDMLELVNNLLDMAKIEAGKFELKKQTSNIAEIIKTRVLFFDISAKDAKVKITSQLGAGIPDKVEFDPHTISQVLNNLISNAIKFNKENGAIQIQALFHKKGASLQKEAVDSGIDWFIKKDINIPDSLFVAVTNTGEGIAEEQINKLFNKFVQVKTVFAKKGGTGLGLAITKSIIESHGGVVGADSVEGHGATFYFTLPVKQ